MRQNLGSLGRAFLLSGPVSVSVKWTVKTGEAQSHIRDAETTGASHGPYAWYPENLPLQDLALSDSWRGGRANRKALGGEEE